MRTSRALASLASLLIAVSACDRDPSGALRLTNADVAGSYAVCGLTFFPTNSALPSVDIIAKAVEPAATPPPELRIDPNGRLDMVLVPKGRNRFQVIEGRITNLGSARVEIRLERFSSGEFDLHDFLLPETLALGFNPVSGTLTVTDSREYQVPLDDYVRLSGADRGGLRDPFPGTLQASFQARCG